MWGDKESELHEYSNRQWAGLIKGFYKPWWEQFFLYLKSKMINGSRMETNDYEKEIKEWEWKWVNSHDAFSASPEGNSIELHNNYLKNMHLLLRKINRQQKLLLRLMIAVVFLCRVHSLAIAQKSNDHIFPANNKAKQFIDFDEKGFLINGRRTFLVSAGMEYARVPHELWHDRLLRLKRAGFNCIEIYTFWNFHEPQEGQFSFSGDHDLNLFLKEIKDLGMYCIARVGPYYCAEWENGGYPMWLRFKPGVRVREHNAPFEKYVDRFFNKLLPVVFANQVNHGGCVIMVQLENEHTKGWGTDMPDGYFHHLQSKALSLGLEVPYFFSGLHHASDPAGDGLSLDDPSRPNPWFSTEFWSVWYSSYSSGIEEAKTYERRTWKIIAHGGNGYNYYMAHGGTNFDYSNNNEDAASYDYGAAVGQAGDLRPMYYSFKRMAWFARSFQNVLENSVDATFKYKGFSPDTSILVTARHSVSGDIIFLDNPSNSVKEIKLNWQNNSSSSLHNIMLLPREIFPVIHNYKLNSDISIQWTTSRILGIFEQVNVTSIVIYGEPETDAGINFSTKDKAKIIAGENQLTATSKEIILNDKFVADVPNEYSFTSNGKKILIIAVSTKLAEHTWFIEDKKERYIICGPAYVGEVTDKDARHSLNIEYPGHTSNNLPVYIFKNDTLIKLNRKIVLQNAYEKTLVVSQWKSKDASGFASANYNDNKWKKNYNPAPMGADGNLTADAWYRTSINIDSAGVYTLQLLGADRITPFVDGIISGSGNISDEELTFNFSKGKHTLAFFTAHDGRDKFAGYTGPLDSVDQKGLFGDVILKKGGSSMQSLTNWLFLKANSIDYVNKPIPASSNEWKNYLIGQDAFSKHEGFGWFQTIIPKPPEGTLKIETKFKSTDENATIFINDTKIKRHEGWNQPFNVIIDHADTITAPLRLTVFIENYSNEGGIDGSVRINYIGASRQINNWRMFGGAGDLQKPGDWKDTDSTQQKGKPAFYQTHFTINAGNETIYHPAWRINPIGLGHGSVWVNGHNLGRYPEKDFAIGLYIPECWLYTGTNTLLIYDEDGRDPGKVSIDPEAAAGRIVEKLTF